MPEAESITWTPTTILHRSLVLRKLANVIQSHLLGVYGRLLFSLSQEYRRFKPTSVNVRVCECACRVHKTAFADSDHNNILLVQCIASILSAEPRDPCIIHHYYIHLKYTQRAAGGDRSRSPPERLWAKLVWVCTGIRDFNIIILFLVGFRLDFDLVVSVRVSRVYGTYVCTGWH